MHRRQPTEFSMNQISPRPSTGGHKRRSLKRQHKTDGLLRQKRLLDARSHPSEGQALLEQCRVLHDIIKPELLEEEPELLKTRWPEYGYLSAFEATEAFTRTYVELYAELRGRFVDSDPHRCPVEPDFVLNDPGTMNALFAARQFADALGLPYPGFIRALSNSLLTDGMYRRVPLPNHLYPALGDTESRALRHAVRFRDQFLEARSAAFQESWDARFLAKNFRGDPAQQRAIDFMVEQAKRAPYTPLLKVWLRSGWISPATARENFSPAVSETAITEAGPLSDVAPTEGLPPYRPHCLGLYSSKGGACDSCPWKGKCNTLVSYAQQEQLRISGYADRSQRLRADARERQRRKRIRDKEKSVPE